MSLGKQNEMQQFVLRFSSFTLFGYLCALEEAMKSDSFKRLDD